MNNLNVKAGAPWQRGLLYTAADIILIKGVLVLEIPILLPLFENRSLLVFQKEKKRYYFFLYVLSQSSGTIKDKLKAYFW